MKGMQNTVCLFVFMPLGPDFLSLRDFPGVVLTSKDFYSG